MKWRGNLTGGLAVLAVCLAAVQTYRGARVGPGVLIILALLLGLRYLVARQARKREEILKAVPRRPLGL